MQSMITIFFITRVLDFKLGLSDNWRHVTEYVPLQMNIKYTSSKNYTYDLMFFCVMMNFLKLIVIVDLTWP